MKRVFPIVFMLFLLAGCGKSSEPLNRAMTLRSKLLQASGCEFVAEITADYSEELLEFKMKCKCDSNGNVTFQVVAPESISGITGKISSEGGNLTFDDHALLFSLMADGRLSPVSGPWIAMRALRSGYIRGCGEEESGTVIHLDDSYDQDSLQVIVHTNEETVPISAEVFYQNYRILTIVIADFTFL